MAPPAGAPDAAPLLPAYDSPAWMAGWPTPERENDRGVRPPRVYAQTRWDPSQSDDALRAAEAGVMLPIARFLDAMKRDGLISGIGTVRTAGMLRCPVKFTGDPWLVERLRGRDPTYDAAGVLVDPGSPGAFWDMFPESEQTAMLWDGIMAGVAVGEMVPRPGKPPRLRHLPLHYLKYRYESDFWYYQSGGQIWAVTTDSDTPPAPGAPYLGSPPDAWLPPSGLSELRSLEDRGRWILFTPYGRERPWMAGAWWPCSLPFITRQNVTFDRLRWQANLADPLKWIEAAEGADERHRNWLMDFVNRLWRRAAGLVTPPKYKPSLVESNGRGYDVYNQADETAARDIQIALRGSTVAVTGGTGFINGSIYTEIGADITAAIAESWATCLHEQGVRPWTASLGQDRSRAPWARWDVRSPAQRKAEAEALGALADAVDKLDRLVLARRGRETDLEALLEEAGQSLPTRALAEATPAENDDASNVVPMRRAA